MLVNRLAGLVLPATSKFLIDDVIGKGRADLLMPLALAAGAATFVQAVTSFALSQVLGVAAQRAITDMRRRVEAHVARLPVQLLRLDAVGRPDLAHHDGRRGHPEPRRHRARPADRQRRDGAGRARVPLLSELVADAGHARRAGAFGGAMAIAFKRLRPLFRERGKINAEVTGRLNETLGGIRIVKTYTAEKREELVFTKGVHRLFRNIARSITGVSAITAFSTVVVGIIGVIMIVDRRPRDPGGRDDARRFHHLHPASPA